MTKQRLKCVLPISALYLMLLLAAVWAQPRTPTVYINEKVSLVELARSQRATLRYDLRPIAGQHLKVKVYHHDQTIDQEPVKEWLFHGQSGRERLSFKDLPLAVYTVVAYCSDEEGKQLAVRAPLIHVEYGGWRAWEKFKPPIETVETPPDSFEEVKVATNVRNQEIGLQVVPRAALVKPGKSAIFKAAFKNMEEEPVSWKLVGEGKLSPLEDGYYLYTAPEKQIGTKLFRVEIQSSAHPELKAAASILVTHQDVEDF